MLSVLVTSQHVKHSSDARITISTCCRSIVWSIDRSIYRSTARSRGRSFMYVTHTKCNIWYTLSIWHLDWCIRVLILINDNEQFGKPYTMTQIRWYWFANKAHAITYRTVLAYWVRYACIVSWFGHANLCGLNLKYRCVSSLFCMNRHVYERIDTTTETSETSTCGFNDGYSARLDRYHIRGHDISKLSKSFWSVKFFAIQLLPSAYHAS